MLIFRLSLRCSQCFILTMILFHHPPQPPTPLRAGIKDLVKVICPRRAWTDEQGWLRGLSFLLCVFVSVVLLDSDRLLKHLPLLDVLHWQTKEANQVSLSLSLTSRTGCFHTRFDMHSMCKQRYCFLDSAVSNAIRMLGCCLSALPVAHIPLLFFLSTKGTQKGWVNAEFAYFWLQTASKMCEGTKKLSFSLPLLFSVCLTASLSQSSAFFLQTCRL